MGSKNNTQVTKSVAAITLPAELASPALYPGFGEANGQQVWPYIERMPEIRVGSRWGSWEPGQGAKESSESSAVPDQVSHSLWTGPTLLLPALALLSF